MYAVHYFYMIYQNNLVTLTGANFGGVTNFRDEMGQSRKIQIANFRMGSGSRLPNRYLQRPSPKGRARSIQNELTGNG